MNKFLAGILGGLLLFVLVGCGTETLPNTPSAESAPQPAKGDSTTDSPSDAPQAETEDSSNYNSYVAPILYFLSSSKTWRDPSELTATDFVMWYAFFTRDSDPEGYVTNYQIEGKDGFHVPAEELEDAAANYFGIDAKLLRSDNLIYNAEEGMYVTPGAVPIVHREITNITGKQENGNLVLDVTVSFYETTYHKIITLFVDSGTFRYISLA